MLKLSRYLTSNLVVRSYSTSKKLFASTSIQSEKDESKFEENIDKLGKRKLPSNPTIAAVFASLKDESINSSSLSQVEVESKVNIDHVIMNAKTVNGLLSITENNNTITRKHALKIVSILAEWSSINKVKLVEFENDSRFTKLCRILGRTVNNTNGKFAVSNGAQAKINVVTSTKKIGGFRTDDLNTVLGVTGDDEAAKLIASITLPQMVKVMITLAQKKRRSTPLLRSLAFNMSSKDEKLDLKQCADVLYAMAILNFPDPVLTTKICSDVHSGLKNDLQKSSVVGSIITSLALLKVRDATTLDLVTEWVVNHQDICRTQDIVALFLTLANLNYLPAEFEDAIKTKLISSLTVNDFKKSSEYLNFVWSLLALNCTASEHFNIVLSSDFHKTLSLDRNNQLSATTKMKLLNINGGVKLFFPKYSGAVLSETEHADIFKVPIAHGKSKELLVAGMVEALKSLIPESYLTLNKITNMGFIVDAEFVIDAKCNPLTEKDAAKGKKIAVIVHDYHDVCQGGHQKLNGIAALSYKLLEKSGYNVLLVPYNEFNTSDKMLKRVQYLEKKIKAIASGKN